MYVSCAVCVGQVLVDAVNFGIVPLVYEYEGTTLDSLQSRLERCLQGRPARYQGYISLEPQAGEVSHDGILLSYSALISSFQIENLSNIKGHGHFREVKSFQTSPFYYRGRVY